MVRACDIGKKNRLDPLLRKYILVTSIPLGLAGMIAGFYLGFGFVSVEAAYESPMLEKIFLSTFIAFSCGAACTIFGAFIGSTIYRFREWKDKNRG
jgi:predicted benzoate:H+ symporter BenE